MFKLAVINIPADDPAKTSALYSKLLNIELTRSPTDDTVAYSAPLSEDGTYISIKKKERPDEAITAFFAVENLDQATAVFTASGGQVLSKHELPVSPKASAEYVKQYKKLYGPIDSGVPPKMGTAVVVGDAEGNRIGLIQVEQHAHVFFKVGAHAAQKTLAQAQTHDAVQEAAKSIERAFTGKP
jgi:predicted enzyme related to lactoylglutathione lyase